MLNLNLQLKPDTEKQFVELVEKEYNGSYEMFVENAINKRKNILSKLRDISEDLGVSDMAENHDRYGSNHPL